KTHKYRFGHQTNAETIVNSATDFARQRKNVGRLCTAGIDKCKRVLSRHGGRTARETLFKTCLLDQPGGRCLDFAVQRRISGSFAAGDGLYCGVIRFRNNGILEKRTGASAV